MGKISYDENWELIRRSQLSPYDDRTSRPRTHLSQNIFEWFTVVQATRDKETVHIIFEEKNVPPGDHAGKTIVSKGFHDITITDFPIRGRRTLFTFRRRRWQVEGEPSLLKRDITLSFPGTQLEREFADFLKDRGRD